MIEYSKLQIGCMLIVIYIALASDKFYSYKVFKLCRIIGLLRSVCPMMFRHSLQCSPAVENMCDRVGGIDTGSSIIV